MVRVLTAADLPEVEPTSRTRLLLARERVMFVGQPVALVVAESETAAADAAPEVNVTYTPLPAATDLESALAADAPLVWPEGATGEAEEAAAHGTDVGEEEGGRQRSNLAGPSVSGAAIRKPRSRRRTPWWSAATAPPSCTRATWSPTPRWWTRTSPTAA